MWAATVVRRAVIAGGGCTRYLLRDRDAIYGQTFKAAVRSAGLRQIVTAYPAPLQNAHAERVIGTIRRECLDHLIEFGEEHARGILGEFVGYYDEERMHQALGGDSPLPQEERPSATGTVDAFPHLGGLHHSHHRAA